MNMRKFILAVLALAAGTGLSEAKIHLPEIIGDNIFFDEQAHPHDWVSGRSSYDFTIKPENIPAGPYNLCVGIVDLALGNPDEGDYRIGIRIAAQGDYTEGGWLKLGKVAIVD